MAFLFQLFYNNYCILQFYLYVCTRQNNLKNKIMTDFTTIDSAIIAEMKSLRLEIVSLNEMEICFPPLTLDEVIKRQNAKNRLFHLIENL